MIEKHKKWLTVLENERAEAVAKREEEVKLKKEIRQKVHNFIFLRF